MARTLANPLHIARQVLRQEHGWLLFLELELGSGKYIRLVRNEQHLQADGRTWQACQLTLELPGEDAEGSMGELIFTVPNVAREALRLVEVECVLLGRTATAWLQHAGHLEAFEPALSWQHIVLDAELTEPAARFRCGHASELHKVPGPIIDRVRFPGVLPGAGVRL